MNENLLKYKEGGFHKIEGWCAEQLFVTFDTLACAPINKQGGCLEIGVHHGRFFILMNQLIARNEKSFALDIFESQELNIDNSGRGSWSTFKENLDRYDLHNGMNTTIITGDSTDPAVDLYGKIPLGSLRFISIDGGHTAEHTVNDLVIANNLISNEGVVILDDILNAPWIGVIEGAVRFINMAPTLVPFAIGHNKLYMCKLSFKRLYIDLFVNCPLFQKRVDFFGHQLLVLK